MAMKIRKIEVKLSKTEFETIQDIAQSQGEYISQYVRNVALQGTNLTYKVIEIHNMVRAIHKKLIPGKNEQLQDKKD